MLVGRVLCVVFVFFWLVAFACCFVSYCLYVLCVVMNKYILSFLLVAAFCFVCVNVLCVCICLFVCCFCVFALFVLCVLFLFVFCFMYVVLDDGLGDCDVFVVLCVRFVLSFHCLCVNVLFACFCLRLFVCEC